MKRNLLALAVGAAMVLPMVAQAAPTVYGRLNLSVDYSDIDTNVAGVDGKTWMVNSNASRVGVKGNEKLSDDFTAVYKVEWTVNGDIAGADMAARERYAGLKNANFGTVRLGYIDSPLKTSEDSVDAFNDLVGLDMENFLTGQTRLSNSINYVSPRMLDVFGANITFQPGEKSPTVNENHLADAYSAAFSYDDDSLYLSAAFDKGVSAKLPAQVANIGYAAGSTQARDAIRLVGRYKAGDFTVSGMFQQSEINTTKSGAKLDEQAFVGSAFYQVSKEITLRGEVAMSNFDAGAGMKVDTTVIGGC